jgi:hypothetical protein
MPPNLMSLRRLAALACMALPLSGCGVLLADSIGFLRVQAQSLTSPPEDLDPGVFGTTPPEEECNPFIC